VRIWKSSFEEAAESFSGQADVLHLDGLHTYAAVTKDLECWLPKLSDGGLLAMHDVHSFPDDVGRVFAQLPGAKTLLDHSAGLGIVSTDARKIDVIEREWKQKLYPHGSGLKHRDFGHLYIQ
jgi:hypothetical protein